MKISKQQLMDAHTRARQACNDVMCAVEQNPRAVQGLTYKPHPIDEARRNRTAHISIAGLIGAWLIKLAGLH